MSYDEEFQIELNNSVLFILVIISKKLRISKRFGISHFLLGKGFISKGTPNTSVILKRSMSPCPSGYSSSTVVLPTLGLRQSSSRPVTGPSASSKKRLTLGSLYIHPDVPISNYVTFWNWRRKAIPKLFQFNFSFIYI
ncbi:unnamed protein product [Meganyctiphanes norvegica]|uniref:Uncharacterized protein n=1 Tax=Meganyctiphanes norvegica TaxID=48144 RepID=A0AAV2RUJ0_MEGNR